MPTLSIITINRNNAEGLRKTIESVVTQTQTDFEYLIIDGASTDESVNVIKEYVEHPEYGKKITYWVSEADTGIYNAMNKGIRLAKGDYLHMLNSGDWYEPNALDYILPKLQEETPDLLLCMINYIVNNNSEFCQLRREPHLVVGSLSHQGLIYNKNLHEINGYYDEKYIYCSDYDFCVKAMYNKNLFYSYIYNPIVNFLGGGVGSSSKAMMEHYNIRLKYGFTKKDKITIKKIIKLFIPYGLLKVREKIKEK